MKNLDRKKAAKKAAKTRASNKAQMEFIEHVIRPARINMERIFKTAIGNMPEPIRLQLVPDSAWSGSRNLKLKHDAQFGYLVGLKNGMLEIIPDGYRRPQYFHPRFWVLAEKSEAK